MTTEIGQTVPVATLTYIFRRSGERVMSERSKRAAGLWAIRRLKRFMGSTYGLAYCPPRHDFSYDPARRERLLIVRCDYGYVPDHPNQVWVVRNEW